MRYDLRMFGDNVFYFTDILRDVVKFPATRFIEVDQLVLRIVDLFYRSQAWLCTTVQIPGEQVEDGSAIVLKIWIDEEIGK